MPHEMKKDNEEKWRNKQLYSKINKKERDEMIRKISKKKFQYFIVVFSLLISGYLIHLILTYPEVGIKLNSNYTISEVHRFTWAHKHGIQVGDKIEKIDDKLPSQHFTVSSYHAIEQAKKISIQKDGQVKEYNIQYVAYSRQLFYQLLIPVGFYITCIFMALYLLIFVPKTNKSIQDLLYFLIAMGMSFISIIAAQRKDGIAFIIASISLVSSFTFFIRFMKLYFKHNQIKFLTREQLRILDIIMIVLIAVNIVVYMKYNEISVMFTIALSIALFLLTGCLLVRFYFRSKHSHHFNFMKVIVMSFFASVIPFICLFLIPDMVYGKEIISVETTGIFFLFIPIYMFYWVISGDLFDAKFMIQRTPYYIMLSIGFTGFVTILGIFIFNDNADHILDTIRFSCITFIATIFFLFIKDYLDFKLRKSLYHHQKNYQFSLYRFLYQAKHEYKLSNLTYSIQREFSDVLKMEEVCYVEMNKENKSIHVFESKYVPPQSILDSLFDFQLETYKVGSMMKLEEHFGFVLSTTTEKVIILLCKNNKKETLNFDEIVWVETLCNYTDLLLECLNQIEDLLKQLQDLQNIEHPPMWLSRLLFKLSEKERANLASDIHDGVLQDQIRLVRKFESYNKHIKDEEMKHILHEIKEQLLDHIYMTRETCNHLRPPFLYELGIKQALLNLFKQINLKATFFFYYDIPEHIVVPSAEHEQAIYRIIQELLNNALKHSKASNVSIKLFQKDQQLFLTYTDNGIGIDLKHFNYSYNTLGLSGIITRIQSLDGEITIDSKPNDGLQVFVKF
nr:ATP-binding protein [Bacillus cytotoxicus]